MGIVNMMSGHDKVDNARRAQLHTDDMKIKYGIEIKYSVDNSTIWTGHNYEIINNTTHDVYDHIEKHTNNNQAIEIVLSNTTDAIFKTLEDNIVVLNFASYKCPGGKFINGSMAQEEAICHDSFLFNVLKEFTSTYYYENINVYGLNKALYTDRALYSPAVVFEKDGMSKAVDVLTCAAPNFGPGKRYGNVTEEENLVVLRDRVKFLANVANIACKNPDTIILGAWGCGVFKQDFSEVFKLLVNEFRMTKYNKVIFALTDKRMFDEANSFMKG